MQDHIRQIQQLTDYRAKQKVQPPEPLPEPEAPNPDLTIAQRIHGAQAYWRKPAKKIYRR